VGSDELQNAYKQSERADSNGIMDGASDDYGNSPQKESRDFNNQTYGNAPRLSQLTKSQRVQERKTVMVLPHSRKDSQQAPAAKFSLSSVALFPETNAASRKLVQRYGVRKMMTSHY